MVEELKFSSEENALQYLSNFTGKKIIVAKEDPEDSKIMLTENYLSQYIGQEVENGSPGYPTSTKIKSIKESPSGWIFSFEDDSFTELNDKEIMELLKNEEVYFLNKGHQGHDHIKFI
jgi:hypothetical protein